MARPALTPPADLPTLLLPAAQGGLRAAGLGGGVPGRAGRAADRHRDRRRAHALTWNGRPRWPSRSGPSCTADATDGRRDGGAGARGGAGHPAGRDAELRRGRRAGRAALGAAGRPDPRRGRPRPALAPGAARGRHVRAAHRRRAAGGCAPRACCWSTAGSPAVAAAAWPRRWPRPVPRRGRRGQAVRRGGAEAVGSAGRSARAPPRARPAARRPHPRRRRPAAGGTTRAPAASWPPPPAPPPRPAARATASGPAAPRSPWWPG